MRVKLLNDGYYGDAEKVKFPVEVEASVTGDGGVDVSSDELVRVGFEYVPSDTYLFFTDEEIERLPDEQPTELDVSHKCCNQFGERDEIQAIINSLQADVVARGNRITELEDLLAEITFMLQSDVSTKVADVLTMLLGDVDD